MQAAAVPTTQCFTLSSAGGEARAFFQGTTPLRSCISRGLSAPRRATSGYQLAQGSASSGEISGGNGESRTVAGLDVDSSRRNVLATGGGSLLLLLAGGAGLTCPESMADSGFTDMPALRGKDYGKSKMKYPDYVETPSGLQYKDLREGSGPSPQQGDMVVIDWDGFTIGYYGRIFEARNKTKGGSFEGNDKDFFRFRFGVGEVIPAFDEAMASMKIGGIRRIIVPPELGYPDNDFSKKGPKPMTFSGQRALDFVLKNQGLIDKTLLFDIELIKILS